MGYRDFVRRGETLCSRSAPGRATQVLVRRPQSGGGTDVTVSFTATNTGTRSGLRRAAGLSHGWTGRDRDPRLLGWGKALLVPGETKTLHRAAPAREGVRARARVWQVAAGGANTRLPSAHRPRISSARAGRARAREQARPVSAAVAPQGSRSCDTAALGRGSAGIEFDARGYLRDQAANFRVPLSARRAARRARL